MIIIQHILKVLALFCLFAILSPTSNVCGEDVEKSGISFALLFDCSSKGLSRLCLEKSFDEGLNVVLVGEIRDHETAEIAVQSSLTGHLVFSTLHTNDSASAITRLVYIGIEPFLISSSAATNSLICW